MTRLTRAIPIAVLTATFAVVAAPLAAPARAQVAPTLTLTATPDPATLGGTITLTATLSGGPQIGGRIVDFIDEETPGCFCGVVLGLAVPDASGVASITVPATSPPLFPPALRTHAFLASASVFFDRVEARTTGAVVCPLGQSPDPTGNACVASYPLNVSAPEPAAAAPAPATAVAVAGRSSGFPLGAATLVAVALILQAVVSVRLVRKRKALG